jgi:hypothetical protein
MPIGVDAVGRHTANVTGPCLIGLGWQGLVEQEVGGRRISAAIAGGGFVGLGLECDQTVLFHQAANPSWGELDKVTDTL